MNLLHINNRKSDSYYDLTHNRITVRGFSDSDMEETKMLIYPGILHNIYSISKTGKIYSIINDSYISWSFQGKDPIVNLIYQNPLSRTLSLERFYIKDLVAYNYIANANDYLERGYRAVNIDGDPMNCNYSNIIYLSPNMKY